jgi:predicted DNA-binding transcriptional regulator AlpA
MAKARGYQTEAPLRVSPLPPGIMPFGLSRVEAAWLIGVSTTMWDAMVRDGRMPKPKRIGARTIWDRAAVERAWSVIASDGDEAERPSAKRIEFEV